MNHKAYQGNPDLKLSCIHGMKQLIEAKKLTQERTWDLNAYISAVQTDQTLAELIRALFIQLPEKQAYDWAIKHLEAIPVNADLSGVWLNFIKWLIWDRQDGVIQYADTPEIKQIYLELATFIDSGSIEQAQKTNEHCDEFTYHLNVENDPTDKYLYLATIAKSILNRFPYQLIAHLQQLHQSLTMNPEQTRNILLATNNGADTLHDFEPGEFEKMFKEETTVINVDDSLESLVVINVKDQLLELLKNTPITT